MTDSIGSECNGTGEGPAARADLTRSLECAHRKTMRLLLTLVGFSVVSASGLVAVLGQTTGGVCIDPGVLASLNECPERLAGSGHGERGAGVLTHFQEARRREETKEGGTKGPSVELDAAQRINREGMEARAWDILQQEERLLKRLVGNTEVSDPRRPEILLRLAETYFEMQQVLNTQVRGFDEPIHQACTVQQNESRCAQQREGQQQAQTQLDDRRREAVRVYATLENDHQDFPRRDEVLFSLAFGLDELGDFERSRLVYRRLIKSYPDSRFVPHAYLSFAEYYFGQPDGMPDALTFYNKVREFPPDRNPVHGYAIYKSAWAHYNLENWRESLQAFVDTIDFATQNPDARDAENLARQSRRELVLPYAQNGTPQRALEFFQRYARNREEALEMLESLGELYTDTGQWPETIQVYHRLMAEQSASDQICYWQYRVTNAVISSQAKPEQVTEMTRLVDLWDTYRNQPNRPAELQTQCKQYAAGVLTWLATAWHREAVGTDTQPGTNDVNTMRLTAQLYRQLIEKFPDMESMQFPDIDRRDWPNQYRVQYFLAELLWKMEDYPGCAAAFDRVVELNPAGEFTVDAADGAVICYNRLYQQQFRETETETRAQAAARRRGNRGQQEEPAAVDHSPREFTQLEAGMLRTFQRYTCNVTESENLVRVKYQRARIFYEARRYQEAAVLFKDIAWNHSTSDVAEFAANLYLECLNILGSQIEPPRMACLEEMNAGVEPLTASYCSSEADRASHGDICSTLSQLECDFERLRAEGLSRTGDHKHAASAYVRIFRQMPECGQRATVSNPERYPDADAYLAEVLNNAGFEFERAHLIGQAIRVRNVLIERYPDSRYAKRAIYLVGSNFHALASYERAAEYFERFATRYSGEDGSDCTEGERSEGACPIAHEALRNALVFRMGLGTEHEEQAIEDAELFARNYRRRFPQETATANFAIGSIYERREDWRQVASHYQSFLRTYRREASPSQIIQANVRIGRANWRRDDKRAARSFFEDAVRTWTGGAAAAIAAMEGTESEKETWLRDAKDGAAEALFYLAEYRYDEFIAIEFPAYRGARSLESVNEWAIRDFTPWLERKRTALVAAQAEYDRIAGMEVPAWMIAAAARIGEMYISIVDQAEDAPVPREIQNDPELYDLYVDTMLQLTGPLREQAVDKFEFCLVTSTNVRWFNEWSRNCESELHRLNPREYPEAAELRSGPTLQRHTTGRPGTLELESQDEEEGAAAAGGDS